VRPSVPPFAMLRVSHITAVSNIYDQGRATCVSFGVFQTNACWRQSPDRLVIRRLFNLRLLC
jgi:hypothetical protein